MDAGAAAAMDAHSTAEIAEYFNSLRYGRRSAQARIDLIVPHLISLLPPRFVPAPDDDGSTSSDDHRFSLTSSDSYVDGAAVGNVARDDVHGLVDHIGRLPDGLLCNIISRLDTNEAARTMVLSTRWRYMWAATPLIVDDAHLSAAVRAVSRCVTAHPGPVRAVRITRISFRQQEQALQRLVADLAAKNVQDLILFNRPWPLDMPLPDDVLSCASLSRLYVGIWRWPFRHTAAHSPAFPNLQELGLFHTVIKDKEVDALLAHCPKQKILSYAMAYNCPARLRVNSRSLRVVVEWRCTFDEVVVVDAPCLERLLFDSIGDRRLIKIVHAPRLEVIGFLDLQLHMIEIGGIVIKAGRNVRACAMLPSVKILAVKVRFWIDMEVKMLPTLLRCFPRLETLHVMSIKSSTPDAADDMDFWKSLASCDCLESHLKTFVHDGYQGRKNEAQFGSYIYKNGKALKAHGIVYGDMNNLVIEGSDGSSSSDEGSDGSSSSDDVVVEEGSMSGSVGEGNASSGGSSGSDDGEDNAPSGKRILRYLFGYLAFPCWSFQNAIDMSVEDPFYVLGHVDSRIDIVDSSETAR